MSNEELEIAETKILRDVQRRHFEKEIKRAQQLNIRNANNRKEITEKTSKLRKLNIFLGEDNLLRSGTRLLNSSTLTYNQKCPIILPKGEEIVHDLIRHVHKATAHAGPEQVRNVLREKFLILSDGSEVKKVVNKCGPCQRNFKKPASQKMAPLPVDRLEEGCPFEVSGIDCFGPFVVKHRGRSTAKRWVVIFTCLKSRAIHLEMVETMSSPSFLNALTRFIARRPGVKKLYSDCGSNFKGAEQELKRAVNKWNDKVTAGERIKNLEWSFLPPMAHHRAGVWERLIRSVRKHLASLLGKDTLEVDTLVTVLAQVEAIINYRPITKVSDDIRDPEALTPAHLLYPGVKLTNSICALPPAPPGSEVLRYSFQRARSLVDAFWKRWSHDYLSTLRERQKWNKTKTDLKVGQVVLLVDEVKCRNDWKTGRIVSVSGDDTHVRTVEIQSGPKGKIFRRDITKVVALELD